MHQSLKRSAIQMIFLRAIGRVPQAVTHGLQPLDGLLHLICLGKQHFPTDLHFSVRGQH